MPAIMCQMAQAHLTYICGLARLLIVFVTPPLLFTCFSFTLMKTRPSGRRYSVLTLSPQHFA